MATDGFKIIDSDTARNTYWGIMDLYDSGAEFKTIKIEFPLKQRDYFDDFDNEIYITSCALALWEIGEISTYELKYVKSIIEKGACVKEWTINSKKDGLGRKKELDKFWKKITEPNSKVRQRKKYKKIVRFFFQPDDLLTFQLKDGSYRSVICDSIDQYRGNCNYMFVPTTYNSAKKPTVEDLKDKDILGRQIGTGYDQQTIIERQPGIERIWEMVGGNCNFFFGVIKFSVNHKDLAHFKDRFEIVGTLKIIEGLKLSGSLSWENSFERFEEIFKDLENHIKIFHYKKYPTTILCDI